MKSQTWTAVKEEARDWGHATRPTALMLWHLAVYAVGPTVTAIRDRRS